MGTLATRGNPHTTPLPGISSHRMRDVFVRAWDATRDLDRAFDAVARDVQVALRKTHPNALHSELPGRVVSYVSRHYKVPATRILGRSRAMSVAWPRMVCYWLLFVRGWHAGETATWFERDASTVRSGVGRVVTAVKLGTARGHEASAVDVALDDAARVR